MTLRCRLLPAVRARPAAAAPGARHGAHGGLRRAQVDSVYFPQHEVVGDIGNGIWQIKEALLESPLPTWDLRCAAWQRARARTLMQSYRQHFDHTVTRSAGYTVGWQYLALQAADTRAPLPAVAQHLQGRRGGTECGSRS